jgi:DNA-binding CsgD family transcriptional regulator
VAWLTVGPALDPRRASRTIVAMTRTIVLWALVLAAGAFALQWLEYQYIARAFPQEIYVAIIGLAFAVGGVWVGWKLNSRTAPGPYQRNAAALASLGLTGQEVRVLERLAAGQSNKEIARTLGLSPNTVKTHIANLFAKLEVSRRTQAIGKARELRLIP